ncbi:hypothetical protein NL529_30535, partial [Klebsiella pneumoniae]|nr:hypothetical protein [Klebsiella pneumoniae]
FRVTDFVPRRLLTLVLLTLAGIAAICCLAGLYVFGPALIRSTSARPLMFDLANSGSLGAWFSSILLLVATGFSLVAYSVRRHKVGD